jgi:hypothetical protein
VDVGIDYRGGDADFRVRVFMFAHHANGCS